MEGLFPVGVTEYMDDSDGVVIPHILDFLQPYICTEYLGRYCLCINDIH